MSSNNILHLVIISIILRECIILLSQICQGNVCFFERCDALDGLAVKNLPGMQKTQVWSLGWGDPLEEGMKTHSRQYSWLENPMDRGFWWTRVYGVAKVQKGFTFTFTFNALRKNNTFCWNHSELCNVGGTDAEAKIPVIWTPDSKNWLIGKDPDAGKDLRQEEKGTTEDEMVGWHHSLNGHEFGWTPGVGDRQGDLVCFRVTKSQTQLSNWTELMQC